VPVFTCTTGAPAARMIAVERRRLIALQHPNIVRAVQIVDRAFQQRRFARARRADQVHRKDFAAGEPGAVARRQRVVLRQDARLQFHQRRRMAVLVPMVMRVLVRVAVPRAVGVDMFLLAAPAMTAHQAASSISRVVTVNSSPSG
jgi:hypothetical protein